MDVLPDMKKGMPIDQALYIELLAILVAEEVLDMSKAIDRYLLRRGQMSKWWGNPTEPSDE